MSLKILGIIPARWASTRFPGKPLCIIAGKSMLQWVYERASKAHRLDKLVVATDDERIRDAVLGFGGNVIMTRDDHKSGTDRAAEVAEKLPEYDIVLNLQGDEPLIDPRVIDALADAMTTEPGLQMATCVTSSRDARMLNSSGSAKVVVDKNNYVLYFSRAAIPCPKAGIGTLPTEGKLESDYLIHVGIYAYRRDFILQYNRMTESSYEQIEGLEQLRALQNGYRIKAVLVDSLPMHIDTPEDADNMCKLLRDYPNLTNCSY